MPEQGHPRERNLGLERKREIKGIQTSSKDDEAQNIHRKHSIRREEGTRLGPQGAGQVVLDNRRRRSDNLKRIL